MRQAKVTFQSLMSQKVVTSALYDYVSTKKIPLDSSDLLRWQWVLAVSALDRYVHDIVTDGIVEQYLNKRRRTAKFEKFQLDMEAIIRIESATVPEIQFRNEVIRILSRFSYQSPNNISDALSYIWSQSNKWAVISRNMATPTTAADLKQHLKIIVLRRNQIVHEGDCLSTSMPLVQQPISTSDIQNVIQFITELVDAIDASIRSEAM